MGALVFCNPLFEEHKSSHRAMVETARAFCRRGLSVLRFDYRGCGDSEGRFSDFRPSDWLEDIRNVTDFLVGETGNPPLGLLGLRLGGAMALAAAGADPRVHFTVAWEPVTKGREYLQQELRKKLMKEMMTFGKSRKTRASLLEALEGGQQIDFDGYAVAPGLYGELCGIDLLREVPRLSGPVLLAGVGQTAGLSAPLDGLHSALLAAGANVDARVVGVQPFWNLIGYVDISPLISDTLDWILEHGRPHPAANGEERHEPCRR